jgi:hypothetical protein
MQGNQIDRKSINGDLLWFHPASAAARATPTASSKIDLPPVGQAASSPHRGGIASISVQQIKFCELSNIEHRV